MRMSTWLRCRISIRTIAPLAYLKVTGLCDNLTVEAIKVFQSRVVRFPATDGRVDPGGRIFQALVVTASGGVFHPGLLPYVGATAAPPAAARPMPGPDGRYTKNPNEVPTKHTVPRSTDVIAMIIAAWPELTQQGARTLTAQFLHETGEAKYCFNWNLGNVKEVNANKLHNYLIDVWEPLSASGAAYDD